MSDKWKIGLVIGGVVIVLGAAGGGVWWRQHQANQEAAELAAQRRAQDSDTAAPTSLGVSGTATNLGQLGDSQNQNGGGAGGNSASGKTDSAQFAQYDKYRGEQNALIGEIQPGTGAELASGRKASIYYKVWLTNGTLVDQSRTSGSGQPQPFSFTLGTDQVIPGLQQGLVGMKAGGKRLIIVPPAVGYGSQGQGSVPPNAVMVFEVQLLSVD